VAELGSKNKNLELHVQCRVCAKSFTKSIAPVSIDSTIRCPYCKSFALAVIENFNIRPSDGLLAGVSPITQKKKKFRI